MVVLEVYTKYSKTVYKNTLISKAAFLVLMCGIICLILPYIFGYKTGGFWLKYDVFYEQPNVKFKGDYLLLAVTDNYSSPIICSSYAFLEKMNFLDICSSIKVQEVDLNNDRKYDEIEFSINADMQKGAKLLSLDLILPIDYALQNDNCPLKMESLIILQMLPQFNDFNIRADLDIFQTESLTCPKSSTHNMYNKSLINEDFMETLSLIEIFEVYSKRTIITRLTNLYSSFKVNSSNMFKLTLKVKYPVHRIVFRPRFWQVLKWAWIQYFSIYIVISWIVQRIKSYIFDNRLVLYYDPTIKNK